jgi:hypothetical protein
MRLRGCRGAIAADQATTEQTTYWTRLAPERRDQIDFAADAGDEGADLAYPVHHRTRDGASRDAGTLTGTMMLFASRFPGIAGQGQASNWGSGRT